MFWSNGRKTVAVLLALGILAAACGDDEKTAAPADASKSAYCKLAVKLDAQDDFPTVAQLHALQDAAPKEIKTSIDVVVPAFVKAIEAGDPAAAYGDKAIEKAFDPIDAYEAKVCGIDKDEADDDQDASVTVLDPAAARVDLTAQEFSFTFGGTPAAGRTSFVMKNAGQQRHLMYLFRIADGATFEQVQASQGDEGVAEDWESDNAAPGDEAVLTADLVPGQYAMICYLPTPEGKSHDSLGMVHQFTVS